MNDHQLSDTNGPYWIQFDRDPDGRVLAKARAPSGGVVIATARADTMEEAERDLLRKLGNMTSRFASRG